jgi:hypothetical protein
MKTVVTAGDGSTDTVYTNAYGQVMLDDHYDSTSGVHTDNFNAYNSRGQIILSAEPSAVSGYNASYTDLLHYASGSYTYLHASSGLITTYDYLNIRRFPMADNRRRGGKKQRRGAEKGNPSYDNGSRSSLAQEDSHVADVTFTARTARAVPTRLHQSVVCDSLPTRAVLDHVSGIAEPYARVPVFSAQQFARLFPASWPRPAVQLF